MHMILYPNCQSLDHCTNDTEWKNVFLQQSLIFAGLLIKIEFLIQNYSLLMIDRFFASPNYLQPVPHGKLCFLIQFNSILYWSLYHPHFIILCNYVITLPNISIECYRVVIKKPSKDSADIQYDFLFIENFGVISFCSRTLLISRYLLISLGPFQRWRICLVRYKRWSAKNS